jgi:hypothetical protein
VRGTPAWRVVETLMAPQQDLFGTIEDVCGIRALDVVDAVALAGDGVQRGFAVLILEGRFTRARVEECFTTIVARDRGAKVTISAKDGISDLAAAGFPEVLHVRWLRDDAVMIPVPERLTDRALLERLATGPRLEAGPLGVEVKAAASAAAWAAAVGDERRGPPALMEPLSDLTGPVPPRRARFRVDLARGLALELRLGFATDAEAATAASTARDRLADLARDPKAAAVLPLLTAAAVDAAGAEVVIRATLPDDTTAAVLADMADGMLEVAPE